MLADNKPFYRLEVTANDVTTLLFWQRVNLDIFVTQVQSRGLI